MIFNCWLQILRAKPINALIAFSLCLSRVRSKKQCIVGVLCPGVQSDCWLPFPEALLVRGRRSGAIQIQTVVPLLHFHIPNPVIVSTLSFIPHTRILPPSRAQKALCLKRRKEKPGIGGKIKRKKPGRGVRGWNRDEGRGKKNDKCTVY